MASFIRVRRDEVADICINLDLVTSFEIIHANPKDSIEFAVHVNFDRNHTIELVGEGAEAFQRKVSNEERKL